MRSRLLLLFLLPVLAVAVTCEGDPEGDPQQVAPKPVLKLWKLHEKQSIVVDGGVADRPWKDYPELHVPLEGDGVGSVMLKGARDEEFLYLLAIWSDATISLNRYWEYVAQEKWERHTGEDAFSICWSPGGLGRRFSEQGCAMFCHGGRHVYAGRSFVDFWYWGAQTTGRKPTLRDMWLPGGTSHRLRGDSQPEGSDNMLNLSREYAGPWGVPMRVGRKRSPYFLDSSNTQPLSLERLKKLDVKNNIGWKVGLDIQRPIKGSRANVTARARHANGKWVLEMRRRLNTGNSDDQPLLDAGVSYWFTVAIHDGTDADAHTISGPIELRFVGTR